VNFHKRILFAAALAMIMAIRQERLKETASQVTKYDKGGIFRTLRGQTTPSYDSAARCIRLTGALRTLGLQVGRK